jgi:hypothetical protein
MLCATCNASKVASRPISEPQFFSPPRGPYGLLSFVHCYDYLSDARHERSSGLRASKLPSLSSFRFSGLLESVSSRPLIDYSSFHCDIHLPIWSQSVNHNNLISAVSIHRGHPCPVPKSTCHSFGKKYSDLGLGAQSLAHQPSVKMTGLCSRN